MKKILLILLTFISFNSFGQSCGNPSAGGYTIPCTGIIYFGTPTNDTVCWFWNRDEVMDYVTTNAISQSTLDDTAAALRASMSGGSGTVTSVTVTTANGFSGTVATSTTTPAITISQSSIGSAVTGTTQSEGDNSTKIATTAYVDNEGIFTTTTHFTVAMIQSLNTTPVQLVPAQGAGYIIVPISIVDSFTYNSATYATNVTAQFYYGTTATQPWFPTNPMIAIASTKIKNIYNAVAANGSTDEQYADNQALMLTVANGNPLTGDGTFTLYVTWRKVRIY